MSSHAFLSCRLLSYLVFKRKRVLDKQKGRFFSSSLKPTVLWWQWEVFMEVCGALGQPSALQGETAVLGKVQVLVGLLSLKKDDDCGRGEQGVGDGAIATHLR